MLFSSISFLYYFLAAVLILYFAVPFRICILKKKNGDAVCLEAKNLVLFISSFFFYFYGEPKYILLMAATTVSSYIHGLLIDRFRGRTLSRVFLWSSVVSSVAVLGFFKYADFFISNANALLGADIPLYRLALPIGISFYTFQTLSYTIDVYRADAKVQRSFIRLATYVALFPQLIAGPIVRYTTVEEDLTERKHSFAAFSSGVSRFVTGLAKKVLIADTLGALTRQLTESADPSVAMWWIYAVAISLQLYFDFSGYSDMAIGLGRIFGFRFLENFNYPFISRSIAEFWRRWHMSLGSWFRDYVYVPLGGNRVSAARWIRNILVVWLLTGFWHGADWTFIIWGLYFALFLMLERSFLKSILDRAPRFVSHAYVIFVILISFVIFSGEGISGALSDLGCMFGTKGLPLWSSETEYYLSSYAFVLMAAMLGATPLVRNTVLKLKQDHRLEYAANILEPLYVAAVLLVVTAYFVDGSFSPFLYFRF